MLINTIKYSTTIDGLSLKIGDICLGTDDVDYATSSSEYKNTLEVPVGGYNIYRHRGSNQFDIYSATNSSELISYTNMLSESSFTTLEECLVYAVTQSEFLISNKDNPNIPTEGLVLHYDITNVSCYPLTGSTIYDMSGNGNNSTAFTASYSSDDRGKFSFDGVNSYLRTDGSMPTLNSVFTICAWVRANDYTTSGSILFAAANGSDNGFRISNSGNLTLNVTEISDVNNTTLIGTDTLNEKTWYHATCVVDTNSAYLYLNGEKDTATLSTAFTIGDWGGNTLTFGARGVSNQQQLEGDIQMVSIYNRVLSDIEIKRHYESTSEDLSNIMRGLDAESGSVPFTNDVVISTTQSYSGENSFELQNYATIFSNEFFKVDSRKQYKMSFWGKTTQLSTEGSLARPLLGFAGYDINFQFTGPRTQGGIGNTTLSRPLSPGDTKAYITDNSGWYNLSDIRFCIFLIFPFNHPLYGNAYEYTRIGYGDYNIYYNPLTMTLTGSGDYEIELTDGSLSTPIAMPTIGYNLPAGTPVSNGRAAGTYNYLFSPTIPTSWTKYESDIITGNDRDNATKFKFGTEYVKFLNLSNYTIRGESAPLAKYLMDDISFTKLNI